jgi:hypothetical protein
MKRLAVPALLALFVLGAAGCFNPFDPLVSTARVASTPAPIPSSAVNAVRLFEWCWKNRGIKEYEELFTDDYRFFFDQADSAGNAYRDAPYTREDELRSATGLFVGTADHPMASDIQLDFQKSLVPLNDDRAGKQNQWHRMIITHVDLKVTIDRGSGPELNEVHGYAKFYVVRGDSAAIPPELASRFGPDSTRWWIERWDDQTLPESGALLSGTGSAASPVQPAARAVPANGLPNSLVETTFGQVKLKGF